MRGVVFAGNHCVVQGDGDVYSDLSRGAFFGDIRGATNYANGIAYPSEGTFAR